MIYFAKINFKTKELMAFTGHEDHDIDLTTASDWTANFRATAPVTATIAHFFGKDAIQAILDQDYCVGIRIYYAIDQNGDNQLIVCGAKANEDDLYNGLLAEKAERNPPSGGASNPLNS